MCGFAVRMKEDRTMIPLNHCDCAAWLQMVFQCLQCLDRPGEMFQDETYENVIEGVQPIGQVEDVRLLKMNNSQASSRHLLPGFSDRCLGYIDRSDQGLWAVFRKGESLCTNAATGLQNPASCRIRGIGVQWLDQSRV